jgi:hypothetical protein
MSLGTEVAPPLLTLVFLLGLALPDYGKHVVVQADVHVLLLDTPFSWLLSPPFSLTV